MKEKSLGAIGNSLAGLVGGGIGGTILLTLMGSVWQEEDLALVKNE